MCKYNHIGVFLAAQKTKAMDDLKNAPWPLIKETASPIGELVYQLTQKAVENF
jgi:hypothetical protein